MAFKIYLSDGITELPSVKSVTYHEAVNAGNELRPGCVSSSYIDVEVFGTQSDAVYSGEELICCHVDNDDVETLIGHFYAEPVITTKMSYRFVAYDAVSKLDTDFSAWLAENQTTFPITVANLVSYACQLSNVNLININWPLSGLQVNAFYADELTCRNIVEYAAELACRFVHCNPDGRLSFDWYVADSTNTIRPGIEQDGDVAYKQDGLNYENYEAAVIDRVAVCPSGTSGAAYIYPSGVKSGNTLTINGNLLLHDADSDTYNTVAENIFTEMVSVGTYRPMKVNLFPNENPFRSGQIVSVTDIQGVSFVSAITGMVVSASEATLESVGTKQYKDQENDIGKTLADISNNIVQINKLRANLIQTLFIQSPDYSVASIPLIFPASDLYPDTDIYPSGGEEVRTGFAIDLENGVIYGGFYSRQISELQSSVEALTSRIYALENGLVYPKSIPVSLNMVSPISQNAVQNNSDESELNLVNNNDDMELEER